MSEGIPLEIEKRVRKRVERRAKIFEQKEIDGEQERRRTEEWKDIPCKMKHSTVIKKPAKEQAFFIRF